MFISDKFLGELILLASGHFQNPCLTKIPQFRIRKQVQSVRASCPRSHNWSEAEQGLGTRSGSFPQGTTPDGLGVSTWERFTE